MFKCLPQLGTSLIYETDSDLAVGLNGRDNIKQVPCCDLMSIFFQKQYDLDNSLAHKHCFILSLMLRY